MRCSMLRLDKISASNPYFYRPLTSLLFNWHEFAPQGDLSHDP